MPRRRPGLAFALLALLLVAASSASCSAAAAQWSLDVEKAMDAIGVAPGMIVGEAGAGDGYFTFPLLRRVGVKGAVYANDIERRALERLRSRAVREGNSNMFTVVGEVDDPLFPRTDLHMIVIVHAFHEFKQPVEWLVNARKYLRPGGTLAIIDIDPERGRDRHHFLPRDRILGYAKQAGYDLVRMADDGGEHMFVVLQPRSSLLLRPRGRSRTQQPDLVGLVLAIRRDQEAAVEREVHR